MGVLLETSAKGAHMVSRKTASAADSAADRVLYGLFVLAALIGCWIGASFVFSAHQSEVELPRRG